MLKINRQDAGGNTVVLSPEGQLTVESVGELREAMLAELKEHDHLRLDCGKVTDIDFFGFQLICSAYRTSIAWKKRFGWSGALPAMVQEGAAKIGFVCHHGCAHRPEDVCCMWAGDALDESSQVKKGTDSHVRSA